MMKESNSMTLTDEEINSRINSLSEEVQEMLRVVLAAYFGRIRTPIPVTFER